MKQATGRRVALASPYKRRLKEAEEELERLKQLANPDKLDILKLERDIEFFKKRYKQCPL